MSETGTRVEDLEQRIAELEAELRARRGPRLDLGVIARELVPSEVRTHLRAAQRERLLAVRAYIDRAIARVEEESSESSSL